jgi:hypothetical protein
MIRVDDPNSIIFTGETFKSVCRFCGKDDSKLYCSICQIAKYCSKECQTYDWKLMRHKLICVHVKSFDNVRNGLFFVTVTVIVLFIIKFFFCYFL